MTRDEFIQCVGERTKRPLMAEEPPETTGRLYEECRQVLDDLMKMPDEKRLAADEEKAKRLLDDFMRE